MNQSQEKNYALETRPMTPAATYRALSDHSLEGILVVETATRNIVEANMQFGKLFNVAPAKLLNRSADEVCRALSPSLGDPEAFCQRFHRLIDLPEASGRFDILMHKDREPTVVAYVTPIRNECFEVIAKLWSFHDASSQQALEKGLKEAQELETTARLAAGIVHDSNNLLTVIIAQLCLAEHELRSVPGVTEAVEPAIDAAEKCGALLKTILKLAQTHEGQLDLLPWENVLSEIEALVRAAVPAGISIHTSYEANLPLVRANVVQLHQVIMNLVLNAKDAMPEGGLIEIALTRQGDDACLTVKDSGDGIPVSVQQRIFDAFFTTKGEGKGTGLGLHMVAGIVKAHDGTIRCESKPGIGTTFRITLPAVLADKPEHNAIGDAASSHVEPVSC